MIAAPEHEAHAPPTPAVPAHSSSHLFTAEERSALQAEDRHAAAMVAGIMLAIFSAAVVMYAIIDWIAWGG